MDKITVYGKSKNGKVKQWSVLVNKISNNCSLIEIEHDEVENLSLEFIEKKFGVSIN